MVHKSKSQQEKLRKDLVANGISLNKVVDFWGKKKTLGDAIKFMDKDDIEDAYRMIAEKDLPRPKWKGF